MNMPRCPSCGKELKPYTNRCEYCGKSISVDEQKTLVEPISPYDDLFSDDIVPPPAPVQSRVKGPVLPPDDDITDAQKPDKSQYGLPVIFQVRRDIVFLAGIAVVGIVLLMIVFLLPPPSSETSGPEIIVNQTPVSENTSYVMVESTPEPTLKNSKAGGYTQFDNFSDKESGWGTYDSDTFMRYYRQDEYHMVQKGENLSGRALFGKDAENFVTEVKTRLDAGPLTGQYGIIFRFSDDNYYVFGINGRGWYTVKKHVDGKVYELIPLTETYILNKGYVTNTLGVRAEGNTLSLYINGKMVRAISDTSLTHGDVGFFVSRLAEKGYVKEQAVHATFDNFKYGEINS